MNVIIAQIFGAISLSFLCIGYMQNKRVEYLKCLIFCNIFYALQYIQLLAFSGLIAAIVCIIKNYVFYINVKHEKDISINTLLLFLFITFMLTIPFLEGPISYFPLITSSIYTFGTWQKNLKISYFIGVIVALIWLYYNFAVEAYVTAVGGIIEIASSIIGLIKLIKHQEKKGNVLIDPMNKYIGINLNKDFYMINKRKTLYKKNIKVKKEPSRINKASIDTINSKKPQMRKYIDFKSKF